MKISGKAISFGVVAWETLSKMYFATDPSHNSKLMKISGKAISFGVVASQTVSKAYCATDHKKSFLW